MKPDKLTIYAGRFQPFTNEDLKTIEDLYRKGSKVILIYVRSHQPYENTPFRSCTVKKSLEKIQEIYPEIVEDVYHSDTWEIEKILEKLDAEDIPVVKSEHDSLKSSVARLAIALDSKNEFCRTVPECLYDMYPEFRKDILNISPKKR